ncbi:hypothetical protein EU527_17455 [Candidatus Thorarchaeota archaeon]|nr:MAG: hypothetical protein EU527_17455 [Candidatus Thorarchaeota archaeon]
MGLLKKLGIILLLYVLLGIVWSVMRQFSIVPEPGGLDGPLNLIYILFEPISFIYFIIVISLGLYTP